MSPVHVSSLNNPWIKEYVKLQKSRRHRQKTAAIALEGPNLVLEALKAGLVPRALFFSAEYLEREIKNWPLSLLSGVKQLILPPAFFDKIALTENPRPVAAIINYPAVVPGFIEPGSSCLAVVLDRVRDPGNMGSIIRTAAAAGVDRLFYTTGCVDPFNPKVLRSSAGNIFHLQLEAVREIVPLIENLKKKGFQVISTSADARESHWLAAYRFPAVLIVGNETEGVAKDLLALSDITVAVPLCGAVESLNVSAAFAVVLYEIIRNR